MPAGGDLAGCAGIVAGLPPRSITSSVVLLSVSPACAPSGDSFCSVALAALLVAGLVGVGAVLSAWAASSSLAEAIVSMGDFSSESSDALVSEPACSSSVLPTMIGEVGDSVAWP